jgi:hypothetical protein
MTQSHIVTLFSLSFQSRTNLQRWIIPNCLSPGNADDDKKIGDFFLFVKKGFWVTKKMVKIKKKRNASQGERHSIHQSASTNKKSRIISQPPLFLSFFFCLISPSFFFWKFSCYDSMALRFLFYRCRGESEKNTNLEKHTSSFFPLAAIHIKSYANLSCVGMSPRCWIDLLTGFSFVFSVSFP